MAGKALGCFRSIRGVSQFLPAYAMLGVREMYFI